MTLDTFEPGEMQPERDHGLRGERTSAGDFGGRKWRHATDGGWFSFTMKVAPDVPVDLVFVYWGSDGGGNREFTIVVDGEVVATQKLDENRPGKFFAEVYPLPEALTRDKDQVTVKLQAKPGKWAGGLFGARLVQRSDRATLRDLLDP